MNHKRAVALIGSVVLIVGQATRSPLAAAELVPEQTCILEITAPKDATVSVDGKDYRTQRRFTFEPLDPLRTYSSRIRVRFGDRRETERIVLLHGGWHIRLPLIPSHGSPPELQLQSGHRGEIERCAFSADGHLLLTGGFDGVAILWDVKSGRQLRTYAGHTKWINGAAITPDGKSVVTGAGDNALIIWDVSSGIQKTRIGLKSCYDLALSPDGKSVVVADGNLFDRRATLWEIQTGTLLRTFTSGDLGLVSAVAFSPDGRHVLTGSYNKAAVLWSVSTGQIVRSFRGHRGGVNDVTFSPDGRLIATTAGEPDHESKTAWGELILWDAKTGRELRRHEESSSFGEAHFAPDGSQVIVGTLGFQSGTITTGTILLGAEQLTPLQHSRQQHGNACAFSSDGKWLCRGRTVTSVKTGSPVLRLDSRAGLNAAQWASDGRHVLMTGERTMSKLDMLDGELQTLHTVAEHEYVCDADFHGNTRVAATMTNTHESTASLVLFDERGQRTGSIPLPGESPDFEGLDDSRGVVLTGNYLGHTLSDVRTGNRELTFGTKEDPVWYAALSPDGKVILTANYSVEVDRTRLPSQVFRFAELRDAQTGRKLKELNLVSQESSSNPLNAEAGCVEFTPQGRALVGAGLMVGPDAVYEGIVLMWDVTSGQLVRSFRGHSGGVSSISIAREGQLLLSHSGLMNSGDDSTILWDATTGVRLRTLSSVHTSSSAPGLGPDGRLLLAVSRDGSVGILDVATGDEVARLIYVEEDGTLLTVTPGGLFDGSEAGRKQVSFRIGGGLNIVPVDRFFQDFYYPGLLAALFRGERPLPEVDFGAAQPPRLAITAPKPGVVDSARATLEVEAVDQGGGVAGLAVFHNGARVLASGEVRREGQKTIRRFEVALIEGANHLRVTAATADGSWEAEPADITLSYERPLGRSDVYLISVGASDYAQDALDLSFASADAQAMSNLFRQRGAALYENVHVTELLDGDCTAARIKEAFEEVSRAARAQDTLVVFLAGHGIMVGQRYYFVPHEFATKEDRLEDDVRAQGLPADRMGDWMAAVPALKRILIFDTCQSGGAIGLARTARNPFAFRGAIERLSRSQGVFTIAATASSDKAQEVPELGHGVLTYSLLAGLQAVTRGPLEGESLRTNNPDNVADVLEWFSFASGHVPRLTRRYFGAEQQVQTSGQGSSFPVLPVEK